MAVYRFQSPYTQTHWWLCAHLKLFTQKRTICSMPIPNFLHANRLRISYPSSVRLFNMSNFTRKPKWETFFPLNSTYSMSWAMVIDACNMRIILNSIVQLGYPILIYTRLFIGTVCPWISVVMTTKYSLRVHAHQWAPVMPMISVICIVVFIVIVSKLRILCFACYFYHSDIPRWSSWAIFEFDNDQLVRSILRFSKNKSMQS